jgi:glutathione S-transferase
MKLLASLTSPYARKVRIVLAEKKIDYSLVIDSPWEAGSEVSTHNPLGKIPVLLMEDGTALYDSRVIVEYLDTVSPVSRLIPEPNRQRIQVRRWEALADGVCDAVAAIFLERKRPARQQSEEWITRQAKKIALGVREMSQDLGDKAFCTGDAYTLADIGVGCALGYLELRYPELAWQEEYPNLLRLAEKLGKRQSFIDSAPPKV